MSLKITIDATGESWLFDNVERLGSVLSATLTQHNIERGADVTDHVQRAQDRYTYSALVSETPREEDVLNQGTGLQRIEGAKAFLDKCFGKTLTLTHPTHATLTDMLLASASPERSIERVERFTLEFGKLRFAEVTTVRVPPSAPRSNTTAASSLPDNQNLGPQATTSNTATGADANGAGGSAAASAETRDRSYLLQLVQYAGYLQ